MTPPLGVVSIQASWGSILAPPGRHEMPCPMETGNDMPLSSRWMRIVPFLLKEIRPFPRDSSGCRVLPFAVMTYSIGSPICEPDDSGSSSVSFSFSFSTQRAFQLPSSLPSSSRLRVFRLFGYEIPFVSSIIEKMLRIGGGNISRMICTAFKFFRRKFETNDRIAFPVCFFPLNIVSSLDFAIGFIPAIP